MYVGVPGSERGDVQTGGGDRVSTISLLGCSTSVALAMGPTDEEEVFVSWIQILLTVHLTIIENLICNLHNLHIRHRGSDDTRTYASYLQRQLAK